MINDEKKNKHKISNQCNKKNCNNASMSTYLIDTNKAKNKWRRAPDMELGSLIFFYL